MSFACVLVPWFAAAAEERCDPSLADHSVVVVTARATPEAGTHRAVTEPSRGGRGRPAARPVVPRVIEANAGARERGIRPGMTETEARARCPELVVRPWSEERVNAARLAMLDAALAVSPRVEDADLGIVHVDVTGLGRLVGDDDAVARRLVRETAAIGLHPSVGVAATRTAARVAARLGRRTVVIPRGGERAALATVSVVALDLPSRVGQTLARWGVRTLGDLARLPRDGVAARLGEEGLAAHDAAAGLDTAPFRPYLPPPFWEEAQSLDWEIDALDALLRVIEGVLARLTARLAAAHVLAGELDLHLDLVSGARHARTLTLAHPLGDVPPMLTLIRLDLERHPPSAAVTRVTLSAHPVRPRVVQPRLGEPASPSVRDVAAVLTRLAAVAGTDAVGSPRSLDTHRPDAFTLVPFTPPADVSAGGRACDMAALALRRLRPPRRVDVEVETASDETRPVRVRVGPQARIERVLACAGPWRRSGTWWDADGWARDEWDALLDDGLLCRLVHDRVTDRWCLDAVYD